MKSVEKNEENDRFIRVAIIDDDILVVKSLRTMINESDTIRVTKIYYDLESGRKGLAEEIPDVLLLDIGFPEGDEGVDFCTEIIKTYPQLKIVMLTNHKRINPAKYALNNGAIGYILKNSEPEEFYAGIEAVSMGEQFLCDEINILLNNVKEEELIVLTPTEKMILKYLVAGHSRKEIAVFRKCKEGTIKIHVRNIRYKFKARSMAELVKKCCDMKYV